MPLTRLASHTTEDRDVEVAPAVSMTRRLDAAQLDVLLRHRLLRKPGGFEGFFGLEEVVNPNDLAVLELDHVRDWRLDLGPASRATHAKMTDCQNSLAEVADLRDLDPVLYESLVYVSKQLADSLVSPLISTHLQALPEPPHHLYVGIVHRQRRIDVPPVPCSNSPFESLDVLLRHRLRSISRQTAAFHARGHCVRPRAARLPSRARSTAADTAGSQRRASFRRNAALGAGGIARYWP